MNDIKKQFAAMYIQLILEAEKEYRITNHDKYLKISLRLQDKVKELFFCDLCDEIDSEVFNVNNN